jgi:hypothetical protein
MKILKVITVLAIKIGAILFIASCASGRELRGRVYKSKDHKTYLVIKEKDNEKCEVHVDGEIWPYAIGIRGEIKPGKHEIQCGGKLTIEIKEGTTFIFDYWGP